MTFPLARALGLLLPACLGLAGACSGAALAPCSVAADCASGVCLATGTCAAGAGDATLDGAGTATLDGAGTGGALDGPAEDPGDGEGDGRPNALSEVTADSSPALCRPQGDGRITSAEVPAAPGLRATYLIASDVAFDSRGDTAGDPRWDLAQSFAGDTEVLVVTLDPAALWFGASFPSATYATRLSQDSDLLGVFGMKDHGLYLLGVVSTAGGPFRTELAYDPPAKLLAYPLELGLAWESTSTVTGLTSGVVTVLDETYQGTVDARGSLATPFADFDALRVVLTLQRSLGATYYSEVQHLFVTECFGTVAALRSQPYERGPELTNAAELRRLSP